MGILRNPLYPTTGSCVFSRILSHRLLLELCQHHVVIRQSVVDVFDRHHVILVGQGGRREHVVNPGVEPASFDRQGTAHHLPGVNEAERRFDLIFNIR